jgi:hypothetical protein
MYTVTSLLTQLRSRESTTGWETDNTWCHYAAPDALLHDCAVPDGVITVRVIPPLHPPPPDFGAPATTYGTHINKQVHMQRPWKVYDPNVHTPIVARYVIREYVTSDIKTYWCSECPETFRKHCLHSQHHNVVIFTANNNIKSDILVYQRLHHLADCQYFGLVSRQEKH